MVISWVRAAMFLTVALSAVVVAGCGGSGTKEPEAGAPGADFCEVAGWCTEHGVPEDICAQCNAKVAAEYQRRGDWCKEHNRPESQCFLCNPNLEAKFAAEYEAKYGQKPPKAQRKPS